MILLALLIGIVAGSRTMLAPAAIAWAAAARGLALDGSWLAFFGWRFTPWIVSLLALGELVGDVLPTTPSRKQAGPFGARLVSGGVSGAAIGIGAGKPLLGLALGVAGAVVGTLGGAALRTRLAVAFGRDLPAAVIEDAIALAAAAYVVVAL
ncbi:membrane protein [Sphingomonas sp. PAMC 26605]|uniref:membrane protein n=1 Tax=Sphingomonas sp. PAMC 26605 TaxID=1112214 RepID=UPI00026CDC0D|nr:membrane protein [Sphingomonas sp. PAMC 26605]